MKAALWAAAALVLGSAIGFFWTHFEFAHDDLPIAVTPVAGGTSLAPPGKVGPKAVVVNGERHDFGTMDRNAHEYHTFEVRNDGDEPLTLTTGQTTCKCTSFAAGNNTVAPKQTVEVKLEWDAKTSEPQFEQSATLHTSDPRRREIHLSVHGRVIDTVRPESFDIHFSNASSNEAAKATVKIFAYRGNELIVQKHELLSADQAGWFNVSFEPLSADEVSKQPDAKAGVLMTVELKSGLPIGRIDQQIRLTTNQNPDAPVTIRVYGDVASDVSLIGPGHPEQLLIELPTISRDQGTRQTVHLMIKGPYRDQTELKIASVEPADEFTATLGEPNRDNPKRVRYPLTIEVPPNARPVSRNSAGAFAQIRLTTTHPELKELTIRVRYVVPE